MSATGTASNAAPCFNGAGEYGVDQRRRQARPGGVVDGDKIRLYCRQCQRIGDRLEALRSAVGQLNRAVGERRGTCRGLPAPSR